MNAGSVSTEPPRPATGSTRRLWSTIAVVVGGLILVNLVAQGIDRAVGGDQPGGTTGSSYATAPDGLAAFNALLSHYGHDVEQRRGSLADHPLPPDATVFVIDPVSLTADDDGTLLQFVTGGGRLVIGGRLPFYLRNLRDQPPTWQRAGETSWVHIDPSFGDVRDIEAEGIGSWSAPGRGRVVVGTGTFALVTHERVGAGEIFFLADASPLHNEFLGTGDNAAFGLALAGDTTRPVVFPEGTHGYGASRGLSAIPDRWKVALVLVAVAALAFVWSRARRFGPPDRIARDLPPARAEYVRALSITLERTHDPAGALLPAQRWARARLAARAGLGAQPNDEALSRAARSFGLSSEETLALLAPVSDDASILALGRAVARVGGDGRKP
jgi:Domain of unknown function (DUF4350)